MAKYEYTLDGNMDDLLDRLHVDLTKGSPTATFEDGSDYFVGETRVAVRVYERYSMIGSVRVSLSITIVGEGRDLFLSAITSGGSQSSFYRMLAIGEDAFLELCAQSVENYLVQKEETQF